MRRRQVEQERDPQGSPVPPIAVSWSEPALTKPGHCPRCGEHIGRAVRLHVETCEAERE